MRDNRIRRKIQEWGAPIGANIVVCSGPAEVSPPDEGALVIVDTGENLRLPTGLVPAPGWGTEAILVAVDRQLNAVVNRQVRDLLHAELQELFEPRRRFIIVAVVQARLAHWNCAMQLTGRATVAFFGDRAITTQPVPPGGNFIKRPARRPGGVLQ